MKRAAWIVVVVGLVVLTPLLLVSAAALVLAMTRVRPVQTLTVNDPGVHQHTLVVNGQTVLQRTHVVDGKEVKLNQFDVVEDDGSVVRKLDWPPAGFVADERATLVEEDGERAIRVEHEGGGPLTVQLLELEMDSPGAGWPWAIRGRVRYEGLEQGAYLEMSSYTQGGRHYSALPLVDGSGDGKLPAASSWRAFEVPFEARVVDAQPRRVVLTLVMPGSGVVEIGPLERVARPASSFPSAHGYSAHVAWKTVLLVGVPVLLIGLVWVVVLIVAAATGNRALMWACLAVAGAAVMVVGFLLATPALGRTELLVLLAIFGGLAWLVVWLVRRGPVQVHDAASATEAGIDTDEEMRRMRAMDVK